jgi:3-dehydroquinate dehydratase-2
MKFLVINGPNLNLLGVREQSVYGDQSFEEYFSHLSSCFPTAELSYYHSNIEGELINKLHEVGFDYQGIVLNAGGYTHTSVALSDAIAAIKTPVIEVHISNVHARESYRHQSLISKNCIGVIAGFGMESYKLALRYLSDSITA